MATHQDFQNGANSKYDLDKHEDQDTALKRIQTAGSISISPELFEKIYLSPENRIKGDLRKTFGNPTPIALAGFLLSLSPLSNQLLGWQRSTGFGNATIGTYFFFGGLLMVIGAVMEWILGNTFPAVVFSTFGSFWLTYGATLTPYYGATVAYAPGENPVAAAENPEFAAGFAFLHLYMGILCFVFLICALRTNLVFVGIFLGLTPAFALLAAAFWNISLGEASAAMACQKAAAGLAFAVCLLGWYLFTAQLLAAVDFPVDLPVIDLSHLLKGGSDRKKQKEQRKAEGE